MVALPLRQTPWRQSGSTRQTNQCYQGIPKNVPLVTEFATDTRGTGGSTPLDALISTLSMEDTQIPSGDTTGIKSPLALPKWIIQSQR